MENCVSYASLAPSRYLNRLKQLDKKSWTLKGTSNYPAFPLAYTFTFIAIMGLSAYMLAYFIINDEHQCYQNIRFGIIALAAIYPIESTAIFVCAIGSIALSQTTCWKYIVISFLGMIVSGFSFGGLGFVYLCIINTQNPILIQVSFLSSNTFIQILSYSYLSFIALYLIVIPIITCAYNSQNSPVPSQRGCCSTICCIIYVFFQMIFVIVALFIFILKILGVPLLIYVLIEITRAQLQKSQTSQTLFYALTITTICLPPLIFMIVYLVSNCFCSSVSDQMEKQQQNKEVELDESGREVVFLGNQASKGFEDDNYQLDNAKL